MAVDWKTIRSEFPALERWTYLNTATYGQLPRCSVEAAARHFSHRDELACADFLDWFDDADRIRGLIARLIHCEAGDIAFIPSAAHALSLLLSGLPGAVPCLARPFSAHPHAAPLSRQPHP